MKKLISIVIPCYRSETMIAGVVEDIEKEMKQLEEHYRYEIILVNDSSPDGTFEEIRRLCQEKAYITGVNLARNFGQHAALMAGFRQMKGDYLVCMDDDGQTPASSIGELIRGLEEGRDVVYAKYEHKHHNAFRNFGSRVNDWMLCFMLGKPKDLYISSFFAAKRFIVDEMLRYQNAFPYVIGLVLRATKTGEADRALLLLTPDGLVSAMAKGALRLKSRLFSGTGLFCYSEFTLFEGKTMFVVDEAEVRQVFWGIHESVEHMALAMYFAELASTLSPTGQEAEAQLRLLLNSLYLLSEGRRAPRLVKAVYELRAMTLAGFMPDLVACADCVKYEGGAFCFDARKGRLYCGECAAKRELECNLDPAALAAMRHIVFSGDDKLFSFSLAEHSTQLLGAVTGRWALYCVDRPLRSLDFLNTVLD